MTPALAEMLRKHRDRMEAISRADLDHIENLARLNIKAIYGHAIGKDPKDPRVHEAIKEALT